MDDSDVFVLGDGRLLAAIVAPRDPWLPAYGLLLGRPERMPRVQAALTWHPELELERTMLTVIIDGVRHSPSRGGASVRWLEPGSALISWFPYDGCSVYERLTPGTHGTVMRRVRVDAPGARQVAVEAALYANPMLLPEFRADPEGRLIAEGDDRLTIDSWPAGRAFERFLTVPMLSEDSLSWFATFRFGLDQEAPSALTEADARPFTTLDVPSVSLEARVGRQYEISRRSLRAAISHEGRFNASLWQYEFEWGIDAAMAAIAATLCGERELAHEILWNLLTRLSNAEGMIAEASRFRGGSLSELNGNGAVLDAVWHQWRYSGDDSLVRAHWERIVAIAEYPLRPEFADASGLLRTSRDFWERAPWQGVGDGFELGHQVLCATGLARASELARALRHEREAARWKEAAERLRSAIVDPVTGLLNDGVLVHRRLASGRIQLQLEPQTAWHDDRYAPFFPPTALAFADRPCEPDATEALAISQGFVDPQGPVARATLNRLEELWDPSGTGGYARYNIASEPDSPGAWPFASAFIAGAQIEAGMMDQALRTIGWLLDSGGEAGSWREYYGPPRTGSLPPIGTIVWGWAHFVILVVEHLAGVRVAGDELVLRPRMRGLDLTVRVGSHTVRLITHGGPSDQTGAATRLRLPLTGDQEIRIVV